MMEVSKVAAKKVERLGKQNERDVNKLTAPMSDFEFRKPSSSARATAPTYLPSSPSPCSSSYNAHFATTAKVANTAYENDNRQSTFGFPGQVQFPMPLPKLVLRVLGHHCSLGPSPCV